MAADLPTTGPTRAANPLRVLWLAKGLGPGGMERLLVTHAHVGDRERFDYRAAYLTERPNSVVGSLRDAGVPCTALTTGSPNDPRWTRRLRAFVRDEGIDVVHVQSPMVAALARPALRTMRDRPAIVYTEHNSWDCYGRATRVANAVTLPLDDARIAVSRAAADSAPTWLGRSTEVVVHGIALGAVAEHAERRDAVRAGLGLRADETAVVVVANLRKEKGYDLLLPAAATVIAAHPDVVFLALGQGKLESEIRDEHRRLGLGDRFRLLGFRDDVLDVMAASDVFALSSRMEGLPVAVMEATALGLPLVLPAVGGLPDVVTDGEHGLLVTPERPDLLAEALVRVVDDAELRAHLSTGSAALAARFDARTAVSRIESIYEQVAR